MSRKKGLCVFMEKDKKNEIPYENPRGMEENKQVF